MPHLPSKPRPLLAPATPVPLAGRSATATYTHETLDAVPAGVTIGFRGFRDRPAAYEADAFGSLWQGDLFFTFDLFADGEVHLWHDGLWYRKVRSNHKLALRAAILAAYRHATAEAPSFRADVAAAA